MKRIILLLSVISTITFLRGYSQECYTFYDQQFVDSLATIHASAGGPVIDSTIWQITKLDNSLDTSFVQFPGDYEDVVYFMYQESGHYIVSATIYYNQGDFCNVTDTFFFGPKYQADISYEIADDTLYIFAYDNSSPDTVVDESQLWIITDLNTLETIDSTTDAYTTFALPVTCTSNYRIQVFLYHNNQYTYEYEAGYGDTTITINPLEAFYYVTDATDNTNCNGSIFIDVNGGSQQYSFQWSNTGTGSNMIESACPGTYSVTINDVNISDTNNCSVVLDNIYVGLSDSLIQYVDTQVHVLDTCIYLADFDTVYISNIEFISETEFIANWIFVSGTDTLNIDEYYIFSDPGYYWLIIGFNCDNNFTKAVHSYGRSVYVDPTITSSENLSIAKATVWPNPIKDVVNITLFANLPTKGNISIIDNTGKIVLTKQISISKGNNYYKLNTSSFNRGIYILSITTNDEKIWNTKIIK